MRRSRPSSNAAANSSSYSQSLPEHIVSNSQEFIVQYPMKNNRYEEFRDADHRHLWHPYTQMHTCANAEPIIIERGEGNYLIDVHGKRYLDGVSSLWCNVHGHRKFELDEALRHQAERIAHSTML